MAVVNNINIEKLSILPSKPGVNVKFENISFSMSQWDLHKLKLRK